MEEKNIVIISDDYCFFKSFILELCEAEITICKTGEVEKIQKCIKARNIHLLLTDHFKEVHRVISQVRFCNPGVNIYYVREKRGEMKFPFIKDYDHLIEIIDGLEAV